jgi:hypothetical protein
MRRHLAALRHSHAVAQPSRHRCDEQRGAISVLHEPVLRAALCSLIRHAAPELRQAVVAKAEQPAILSHDHGRVQGAAHLQDPAP